MESVIARELKLAHSPVAVLWSDEKPEGAIAFEKGRWGCVMAAFGAAAERGKIAAFDRESYGCPGGGVGLAVGEAYLLTQPGGLGDAWDAYRSGNLALP